MISAVASARIAGLDRIKSGFTSRFANRLPIFGASRLPRSSNGRSLSANAVSPQLDLAWRMRNSVFMLHPVAAGSLRPQPTRVALHPDGRYGHRAEQALRGRVTRRSAPERRSYPHFRLISVCRTPLELSTRFAFGTKVTNTS